MSKIKKITVSNLKAISLQSADFNGCTAIITGGNNKGKTSLLRSLFDRIRGVKADAILKHGETEGFAEAELTTGEKIKWEFNDKGKGFKEKLTYITEKDIKTSLTTELRNRFAPDTFDVDKFLTDPPQKQRKTLQDLAGLDFTDIDTRYTEAYKARTAANTLAGDAKTVFENTPVPEKVEAVNIAPLNEKKEKVRAELNTLYLANKKVNDEVRAKYNNDLDAFKTNVDKWNHDNWAKDEKINSCISLLDQLKEKGYTGSEVMKFIDTLPASEPHTYIAPVEPTYITELPDNAPLLAVEKEIEDAHTNNQKANTYMTWLDLQNKKNYAASKANEADVMVKAIEQERTELIKTAKMPEGFSFTDDGIAYNGLSFTREQLSSSGIYIAALKLASMKIGEIRSLHFDASFLDKNSLAEIEAWAVTQDLQLLIERPDFEGGEITYELIQSL